VSIGTNAWAILSVLLLLLVLNDDTTAQPRIWSTPVRQ